MTQNFFLSWACVCRLLFCPGPLAADSLEERFEDGKKTAVIIGVNRYVDKNISNLRYCVSDAHRVRKVLVDRCGYPSGNVVLMTDDQPLERRPNRSVIRRTLRKALQNAHENDTLLVYFSGHGFVRQKEGFLAPSDCYQDSLSETAIRIGEIRQLLSDCKAKEKLLVLDCCHAAAKGATDPSEPSARLARMFGTNRGLITFASCGENEQSHEWPKVEQGLFSYYFCRGLQFDADANQDNIVDSSELYKYIHANVVKTGEVIRVKQTPREIRSGDVAGVFPLAKVFERGEVELPFYLGQAMRPRAVGQLQLPPPPRFAGNFGRIFQLGATPVFQPPVQAKPAGRPKTTTAFAVLGVSRANAKQRKYFQEAETWAEKVQAADRRAMLWLALARSYCIVSDKAGYQRAVAQVDQAIQRIDSHSAAASAAWRTTEELTRLGDEKNARRMIDLTRQRAGAINSPYTRGVYLAALGGAAARLRQKPLATELVQAATATVNNTRIQSHVSARQDYQSYAVVIAACQAQDLKQATTNLPGTIAGIDDARYLAVCEIAAAAARQGDAAKYGDYVSAAAAMTAGRKASSPVLPNGRWLIARAHAYAGNSDLAAKEAKLIPQESLQRSVWLTIVETQVFRQQIDQAIDNFPRIEAHPQSLLTCCFLAENAPSLQELRQWSQKLPEDQRAAVFAGLGQRPDAP